jgi:hypothetical protein
MHRALLPFLLFVLSPSLFGAGHDISAIRTAPSNAYRGKGASASNGSRFLHLWPMAGHLYRALDDPALGARTEALPVVQLANPSGYNVPVQLTAAGSGYVAIWNDYAL